MNNDGGQNQQNNDGKDQQGDDNNNRDVANNSQNQNADYEPTMEERTRITHPDHRGGRRGRT